MKNSSKFLTTTLNPSYLKRIEDARAKDHDTEPYGLEYAIFQLECAINNLNVEMAKTQMS